ncbi:hypothetical protein NDA11_001976 [Ustilago hordei]|uniref:Uncharacterized protein n=1 Tax=Ustilago hordei TaxID=120017 RepID=I2G441_USTHO|nr:uncharacterized protein UHO2_01063 [Ustilago hordei]KAJ1043452.1 hypothetical protein NDA10_002793 [Ustilago hordei]KAJ1583687.1 hypothetical protein NDA15_005890 [Ustilago hordei]KAJ1584532.1 hypothetical protein NDA11_001976 [Ustilago hordei]KAJ1592263.1 hypothetical protein NDA12_007016 [Ustilago hordei]KAJ1602707.1 hypothetical protein NDA14_000288 [Ustilago hordei]
MYSTSPSSSSMASSSGRSSPDQPSQQQSTSQAQRSNSFLLPQFFWSSSSSKGHTSDNTAHPLTTALLSQPPRRTSFGAGFTNSGRFSALSAFGFMSPSTGLSSSPPLGSFVGAAELSKRTGSAIDLPSSEGPSKEPEQPGSHSTSATTPAATPAPPAKRHLCFPDAHGGTMCLEIKDRNRRGSSVN